MDLEEICHSCGKVITWLLNDQILEAFPPGVVPPVEEVTLRTEAEMEPYLREPVERGLEIGLRLTAHWTRFVVIALSDDNY